LSGSADVEKKIRVFNDIGDIIDAMKAYAGVAMRKTEALIANVREYERKERPRRLLQTSGNTKGMCSSPWPK